MKKITFLILSLLLTFSACENVDFGDTNDNPNGAKDVLTSSMFGGAVMRYAGLGGREYLLKPTLYVQWQSQIAYTDEMLYNEAPSTWFSYYVQTLSNLQTIINICEDPANHTAVLLSQGAPENQEAQAIIMKAIILRRITDAFGNIPYSEALDPSILTPAYDTQEAIYKGLISELKAARDMMDATKKAPTGDPIYKGNVAKWRKLANSTILSMSLQLSKRYPAVAGYAQVEFSSALTNTYGVIETLADEAWFTFDVPHGFVSPWDGVRAADYRLSLEFTNALKGKASTPVTDYNPTSNRTADSRLTVFSETPAGDGLIYGYDNPPTATTVGLSPLVKAAASPTPLMTASYTFLNRAEAAARGWTAEVVNTMFTNGVVKSFEALNAKYKPTVSIAADGAAYAAARIVDMGTTSALQVIAEEKWVATFPDGFLAWAEWRRTGFPLLVPAVDALNNGQIPRRLPYPTEEAGQNPAGYAAGVAALTPASDNNTSKMWWDN